MIRAQWQKFSLAEQLGNIGSEVNRAIYWKEKRNKDDAEKAAERVLEFIDLTVADKRRHSHLKEILRLREVFCDYFFDIGNYDVSSQMLKNYFLPFALLAKNKMCLKPEVKHLK